MHLIYCLCTLWIQLSIKNSKVGILSLGKIYYYWALIWTEDPWREGVFARRCQFNNWTNRTLNQLNAIERNWMIEIRLPSAIESQLNITVIFSIDLTNSIASTKFDWLVLALVQQGYVKPNRISIESYPEFQSNKSNFTQNFKFDWYSIAFDNWIAIIWLIRLELSFDSVRLTSSGFRQTRGKWHRI